MTLSKINDLKEELLEQKHRRDYIRQELHNAIDDRDLGTIISRYYMLEEYEAVISDLCDEIDEYSSLN